MKFVKILFSSLVLLLVGCEELGITVEDVERVADDVDIPEYNVEIMGLDPISLQVGEVYDLEKGVSVEGVYEFELIVTDDINLKIPGTYSARYRVLVGNVVIYEQTREVKVQDTPVHNVYIKGLDPIKIYVGDEINLEEGVFVEGVEEYELKIDSNHDTKRPGGYVARYMVLVDGEVVHEAKREIYVIDAETELDIYIKGVLPIEVTVGTEIDLESGVEVVGIDLYELRISSNHDTKRPGRYVATYMVVVEEEILYKVEREIIITQDVIEYMIHIIGSEFDKARLCDGIDDDCDGLADDDLQKEGLIFAAVGDIKVPIFIVEEHHIVNPDTMRFYNQRKFSEQELNAIEIAGDLYTMHYAIEVNPLATGGVVDMISSLVDVTEEQLSAFAVIQSLHLEAVQEVLNLYYPEIGDEVLVCFQEENLTRISLVMDTSTMKAKEKANKTKCSSNLRTYLDDDSDGDGLEDAYVLDQLRNTHADFRTDSFFDISYDVFEETLGRPLTVKEKVSLGGLDNDCNGYCESDPYEVLLGRFYSPEFDKALEFLDLSEFIQGEYASEYNEVEIKPIRIEMAAYRAIVLLEHELGMRFTDEEVETLHTRAVTKFKAGADLSSKVNLRGSDIIEDPDDTDSDFIHELYNGKNIRKNITTLALRVYGPGDAHFGSITFELGRDITDTEILAMFSMRNVHMTYYNMGGVNFLDASIDEILATTRLSLTDEQKGLLSLFQTTLQAQDYNSSRSNTDG